LDEDGRVLDRRAGRIRDEAPELAEAIDRLHLPGGLSDDVEVRVKIGTEHRLAIVLRGTDLSSKIQGSDPGERAASSPPLTPRPLDPDDEKAVHTARALALFEQEVRRALSSHPVNQARLDAGLPQANAILTRGAGRIHKLIPLEDAGLPLRICCISGDRTVLGLARLLGADTTSLEEMTGNLDTNVQLKLATAREALKSYELVIVHIKGADIAAHDRRPDLKAAFLEKIDRELMAFLNSKPHPIRIAVASDHATLSESGQHAADPLPILIWGEGIEADAVHSYSEQSAGGGQLHRFPLQMLLGRLFQLS
jgi:2,3-bisphosphoglycerate-independent phosphoglycerate mutase